MTTWQKCNMGDNTVIQCLLLKSKDSQTSEVARLSRSNDGDWEVTSKILNMNHEYLASDTVTEEDAKSLIEVQLYRFCADQRKKYNDLCNSLCFS